MSNNCWRILQIPPTHDETIIKRAYAKLLKDNKPDKNPDGFKRLREAYDTALRQRHWYESDDEDDYDNAYDSDEVADYEAENDGINQQNSAETPSNHIVTESPLEILPEPIPERFVPMPYEHGKPPAPNAAQNHTLEKSQTPESETEFLENINPHVAVYGKVPDKRFEYNSDEKSESETELLDNVDINPPVAVYGKVPNKTTNRQFEYNFSTKAQEIPNLSEPPVIPETHLQTHSQMTTVYTPSIPEPIYHQLGEDTYSANQPANQQIATQTPHEPAYIDKQSYEFDDSEQLNAWMTVWQDKDDIELSYELALQFAKLKSQSLDFKTDYEVALLEFLANHDQHLSRSFRLSFEQFNWQQRLDSWQVEAYPWSMLQEISQRYPFLDTLIHQAKAVVIQQEFPIVFEVWQMESLNRKEFLRQVDNVPALAAQLGDLNEAMALSLQLQSVHHGDEAVLQAIDSIQNDSNIRQLNQWLLHRIVTLKDYIVVAVGTLLIGGVFGIWRGDIKMGLKNSLLLFIGMALWLEFWQLAFKFFAYPHKFTFDSDNADSEAVGVQRGIMVASVVLFAVFYLQWQGESHDWKTSMAQPSYFLSHLAGLAVWWLVFYHQQDKNFAYALKTLNGGFLLIITALVVPLVAMSAGLVGDNGSLDIVAISPLWWWVFALPLLVHRFLPWQPLELFAHWLRSMGGLLVGFFLMSALLLMGTYGYGMAGMLFFLLAIVQYGLVKGDAFVSPRD